MPTASGSVVALGGSAGGVDALSRIAAGLPADLGAPVLVVRRIANRIRVSAPGCAERYDRMVEESERDALVIRRLLLDDDGPGG